jgi:lactoylglutathione lyase
VKTLHLGLRVCDLERSLGFYTCLGYEVLGEVPETEFGTLTMLKLPCDEFVTLELIHDPAKGHLVPAGFHHLVVQVEAVHAVVSHLAAQGYRAAAPTSPDSSHDFWTAWVTDPDGYHLELVQWPSGHPDGMTRSDFAKPDDEDG